MNNPPVNRYLKDTSMDRIDHALGRPFDPLGETTRNHFATDLKSPIFLTNPHWKLGKISSWQMEYWHVTDEGREALAKHLKAIRDPHRRFSVEFDGFTACVIATSASKARYLEWLDISDTRSELTFGDFQRQARVRVMA